MRGLYLTLVNVFLICIPFISRSQTVNLTCQLDNPIAIHEIKYQKVYTNISIPQTDKVKGYIEHLPNGYNAQDATTKYPVVIMLHVLNEWGNGSATDMCKFFANKYQKFPYVQIEEQTWPQFMTVGQNDNRRFLTLTPQFTTGTYSVADVNNFLDYVLQRYNVDPQRVYLMGTSQGANVALQFIGSSEANAKKIAGVLSMSPCMSVNETQARNIKNGGSGVWVSQCNVDAMCNGGSARGTYNALKAAGVPDEKNVFSDLTSSYGCNMGNTHDSWTITLSNNFTYSTLSTPKTIFQWFGSLASGQILPVTLKSFDVKLLNHQTWISWETTQEENGEYFFIQRAGDDMNFVNIDSVLTKNFAAGSKYQVLDANPAIGNNYYRLMQKDIDGKVQVFDIKKIMVQSSNLITILNNPFQSQVKFSVQSTVADQYQVMIRDIQGKLYYNEKLAIAVGRRDIEISAGHWPSGMYILTIQTSSGIQTHKLIKR